MQKSILQIIQQQGNNKLKQFPSQRNILKLNGTKKFCFGIKYIRIMFSLII